MNNRDSWPNWLGELPSPTSFLERLSRFGSLLWAATVLSISAYASKENPGISLDNASPGERNLPRTEFGQFPACTKADLELERLLRKKDKDIDLALANWIIATDVPQFSNLAREAYFAQLDALTERVRQDMARMQKVAVSRGKITNDPDTRCAIFCNAIINRRFAYVEEFRRHDLTFEQNKALQADANNTFLAGLLRTHRGSCVSMPLIYLVIGQRLEMPVHLVAIGKHYFIRWQEPGYRMNIESTASDKVWVTAEDSAYIENEGLTREKLRGSDLRNLTNREVVGQLFFTRSGYWAMSGAKSRSRSWMDLSRAQHLSPEDSSITKTYQAVFSHYGITSKDTLSSLQEKERNSYEMANSR